MNKKEARKCALSIAVSLLRKEVESTSNIFIEDNPDASYHDIAKIYDELDAIADTLSRWLATPQPPPRDGES